MVSIQVRIAEELGVKEQQVQAAVDLIDDGGQHSANLIVYSTQDYPRVDLRVDEDEEPIGELRRLHDLYTRQADYYENRPWQPDVMGSEAEYFATQAVASKES